MTAARRIKNELDRDELGAPAGVPDAVAVGPSPPISIRNVSFEYTPGVPVLQEVDLEIKPGSVVHRVRVGPFASQDDVSATRQRLRANGIDSVLMKVSG